MTRQEFLQLPEREQNMQLSKFNHALRTNDRIFEWYTWILEFAEQLGLFDTVKLGGSEVYKEEVT